MKIIILFLCIFYSSLVISKAKPLEIDEKLTIRILQTSSSKKTVLINRGHEDGITVNTHAKFFLTTGVFARGVARKVSPARSIWSVYRIVKPEHIVSQKVANIKISLPIKLTEDPAQGIVFENRQYDIGEPKDLAPDEDEISQMEASEQNKDLGALIGGESKVDDLTITSFKKSPYQFELGAKLSMNLLSGTYSRGSTDSTVGTDSNYESSDFDITLSGEKLFPTSTGLLRNVGLKGIFAFQKSTNGTSVTETTTNTILGVGLSYYLSDPFTVKKVNYFLDANFGTVTSEIATTDSSTPSNDTTDEGSGTFFSLGIGAKYLVSKRFGATAKLDYYSSSTSFDYDDSGSVRTDEYSLSGPRVLFGLFARVF